MSSSVFPISTARLTLREPTDADLDQVLRWRNDPAVTRWLLTTEVDPAAYREAWLQRDDPNDHGAVALLGSDVIGTVTLGVADAMGQGQRQLDAPWADAEGSIGYLLDPTVHGRGFGSELVLAILSVAFDDLGLHRVTAGCFADNVGSWRVMEKAGMRREQFGVQDSWHAEHGWVDGCTYALLGSEWDGSEGQRVTASWRRQPSVEV